MTDVKTCSRPGCDKKLRSDNSTGLCSTNCRSPEAPPAMRAKEAKAAPERAPKAKADSEALERFRVSLGRLVVDLDTRMRNRAARAWVEAALAAIAKAEGTP